MIQTAENQPRLNTEGYKVAFIEAKLVELQMLAKIRNYAQAKQEAWQNPHHFDPRVNPVLIGYTFALNQENNVFEVYPVYQHDVLVTDQDGTRNTGRKTQLAIDFNQSELTVASWAVEDHQIQTF